MNQDEDIKITKKGCPCSRNLIIGIVVAVLLLSVFIIPKYFIGNVTASETKISGDIEKVEVYHFHATRQCYSCKTLGTFAEETVNTYYSNELKSGKLVFAHVNVDLSENKALVEKYEAKGSSLIIGVSGKDGSFTKEENINVWYKIDNKEDYMEYLKGIIEQKLLGN